MTMKNANTGRKKVTAMTQMDFLILLRFVLNHVENAVLVQMKKKRNNPQHSLLPEKKLKKQQKKKSKKQKKKKMKKPKRKKNIETKENDNEETKLEEEKKEENEEKPGEDNEKSDEKETISE